MVLSNKKLKQKLRAAVADSLTASIDLDSESQQLKQTLKSAKQRQKLKKRENRQESFPQDVNGDIVEKKKEVEVDTEGKKKRKKRKREINENGAEKEEDGGAEKGNELQQKKKKKKIKKKEKKKGKNIAEKEGSEVGNGEQGVRESSQSVHSQENGDVPTKIYVGGIPYYSTEDDIRSYFDSCGTITKVDCMKFPESGKFRGIAIMSFKTEAAAKRALALDGSDMGGLYLKIQPYKSTRVIKTSDFQPKIVEGYNRIYVGNLSWDITEDDLRKLFKDCKISSIRFGIDKDTGEFRGYAHVDFSDSLSLTMALKLDQHNVCGRPVKISCAVPLKGAKFNSKTTSNDKFNSKTVPSDHASDDALDNAADVTEPPPAAPGNGKIRRRKCYECGEKGHISSACPNKKTDEGTDSNPS